MKIENKSGKIIGIDGKAILPGETGEISDSYKDNPVITILANDPDLTVKPANTDTTSQETSSETASQETASQTKAAKTAAQDKADGKS